MTTDGGNLPVLFGTNGESVEIEYDPDLETFWATRREIARLFACTEQNVDAHLKNIYSEGEIEVGATTKKNLVVQSEGGRSVKREVTQYNLDAIISVGYRVNSAKATRFRQQATAKLREFIQQGAVLDEERLANDPILLQQLAGRIRRMRHSEANIYRPT